MDLNKSPRNEESSILTTVGRIRCAVDHIHPEALFIASQLSSVASNPGKAHVGISKYCLRYLKGVSKIGLTLGGPQEISPEIHVDASYIEEGVVYRWVQIIKRDDREILSVLRIVIIRLQLIHILIQHRNRYLNYI